MGITRDVLQIIEGTMHQSLGELRGTRMLELGNQELEAGLPERLAKRYFEARGVLHTSVDLNGLDGAIVVDLSEPGARLEWVKHFDIVTNCGTTEHVAPHGAQYEAFRNVHTWLRVGGIAVHALPDIHALEECGTWRGHCDNYYSEEFVYMLAKANRYEILSLQFMSNLLVFCLRKNEGSPFMSDREMFVSHVAYRKGGYRLRGKLRELGLYPRGSTLQGLHRLLRR